MSDSAVEEGCCFCCFKFTITVGLAALFLWLTLRATDPTYTIHNFYLPALNKSINPTPTLYATIEFQLQLKNGNRDKAVYYDALNLTFYYGRNRFQQIGNFTIPGFHQGHAKKAKRNVSVHTDPVSWQNGWVDFRVDLTTRVRLKTLFWKTKRHRMVVGAVVTVNDEGTPGIKFAKKGIKLKSSAPEQYCYSAPFAALVSMCCLFLLN